MHENIKKYAQMREEFYEKLNDTIIPIVKLHKEERKKRLILVIAILLFFFILGSIIFFLVYNRYGSVKIAKLIISIYTAPFFIALIIEKNFENSIKQKIMPTVCQCIGDLKWSNGIYKKSDIFLSSCIIPKFTKEHYDDIFMGSYKDINLEVVESKYTDCSGKHEETIFQGVIIKLDMNKNFTSHTVISPNIFLHKSLSHDLHFTELEDTEFNKKFDVFTNDEVDARYLITPSFMERLKNIKVAFSADEVICSFYEKYLIIGLETVEDLFSISLFTKPMDDKKQYVQMFEEILSIVRLIDYFKLDEKIGL